MNACHDFMFEFVTGKTRDGRYVRMRMRSEPALRKREQDLHIRLKADATEFDANALAAALGRLVARIEIPGE
jgi:hypothetical protein